ncbi:MAG: hypothetical protein R3B47_13965 [Bacteroidia bacterium]
MEQLVKFLDKGTSCLAGAVKKSEEEGEHTETVTVTLVHWMKQIMRDNLPCLDSLPSSPKISSALDPLPGVIVKKRSSGILRSLFFILADSALAHFPAVFIEGINRLLKPGCLAEWMCTLAIPKSPVMCTPLR